MAGSFLHLHLALSGFATAFARRPELPGAELPAFLAGSIAPDVGFFPGGPATFSDRVHHESTGDLVRTLLSLAETPEEVAFAAGWALHVETDVATHPFVNRLAADPRNQPRQRLGLWHKRVEWGLDCQVLDASHGRLRLWEQPLVFPVNLLARAAQPIFGADVDVARLQAGVRGMPTWLHRIARTLLWSTTPWRRLTRLARPLERFQHLDDPVALLTPVIPTEETALEFLSCAASGVAVFQRGWVDRFTHMANRDLDTGQLLTP